MQNNTSEWARALFADLDREGVEGLFPYLHDDVKFRFASYPPGTGKQTFADAWAVMSPHIESLNHDITDTWQDGDAVVCRGDVTYGLKDGREITLPFANIFRMRADKIAEYLIYIDASPVFGPAPG